MEGSIRAFSWSICTTSSQTICHDFFASLLTQNLSGIFGERVRGNMEEARQILDGYVAQELESLGKDVAELERGVVRSRSNFGSRISFTADLMREAQTRDLDAVYILREDGFVLTRAETPEAPELRIPGVDILKGLQLADVAYQKRKSAASQIARFNESQSRLNQLFFLTLVNTALLILMAAIWLGLTLANRIIHPLSGLVNAAERVRAGDMGARVNVAGDWGEISDLGSAFNRMTSQLESH